MQEKTLLNPKLRTSNIHSMDFGSVSYDIFGYLGKPYNADTELYDFYQTNEVIKKTIPAAIESGNINSTKEPSKNSFLDTFVSIFQNLF